VVADSATAGVGRPTQAARERMAPGARIDRAVVPRDHLRGPSGFPGLPGRKEWFHFCIQDEGAELLVNFSLCDALVPGDRRRPEVARLTVLARDGAFTGDVDVFDASETRTRPGAIDLEFGGNRLAYRDGRYAISLRMRDRPIEAELVLRPLVVPTLAPNIPLPDGPPLQWAIVPRLVADGWMRVDGRERRFAGALAYHDHNWGRFLWGHRFSWIWGFCLPLDPAVPWTVVFVRLANRLRTRALAQGLFLWRREEAFRIFRERDLAFALDLALLRPGRVAKVPAVMAIVAPERATDVPRSVDIHAAGDGDELRVRFDLEDLAQVVIPSETDLGVTVINEVSGLARVSGSVRGEPIAFDARGMCEFLGN